MATTHIQHFMWAKIFFISCGIILFSEKKVISARLLGKPETEAKLFIGQRNQLMKNL